MRSAFDSQWRKDLRETRRRIVAECEKRMAEYMERKKMESEDKKNEFDEASRESWEKGINPKDLIGSKKLPLSLVPPSAIMGLSLALKEGAIKYGPYNWRDIPIRQSMYLEACLGHIEALIDGEDIDPDSGLWHVYKAQACLAIIADAHLSNSLIDDRHTKQRLHKGGFSRDPSKIFGDPEKIKHLMEQPVRESSIGTQPPKLDGEYQESSIPLRAIVVGVTAIAQYADEQGNIPRTNVCQAFEDALSAVLPILKTVNIEEPKGYYYAESKPELESEIEIEPENVWRSVLIGPDGSNRGVVRFNGKPTGEGYIFAYEGPDGKFRNTISGFLKFTDYKSRILLPKDGLPDWAIKQLTDRVWPVG